MQSCAVIIIAQNEEVNISNALNSVMDWTSEVFVVDAFSADNTLNLARKYGAQAVQHKFESVGCQRNWALKNLDIRSNWILFLDADEYLSEEIKTEIDAICRNDDQSINGFITKIKFMYLGRWLKHGDLYSNVIRLIRKNKGYYIDTLGFHERMVIDGRVGKLESYIVHDDQKSLSSWIEKQLPRILIDANLKLRPLTTDKEDPLLLNHDNRIITVEGGSNRYIRGKLHILPSSARPFAQFFYRYIIRLGFLDGWQGFIYNFLLQFWYPFMVEAIYLELKYKSKKHKPELK